MALGQLRAKSLTKKKQDFVPIIIKKSVLEMTKDIKRVTLTAIHAEKSLTLGKAVVFFLTTPKTYEEAKAACARIFSFVSKNESEEAAEYLKPAVKALLAYSEKRPKEGKNVNGVSAIIDGVFVSEKFRGTHIASRLVDTAFENCENLNVIATFIPDDTVASSVSANQFFTHKFRNHTKSKFEIVRNGELGCIWLCKK